jgi:AraC family transcriptional activator FtrA
MASLYAQTIGEPMTGPRLVVSIVYDELWTFDFAMTTAFALEWPSPDFQPYRFVTANAGDRRIRAFGGLDIEGSADLDVAHAADLLILPGWRGADTTPGPDLVHAIRSATERGACVAALGVGVFVLAYAGVLRGKRATTHWYLSKKLARDFPDIRVVHDSIYVRDGNVYTSAGSLSGIDMLLTIIRQDYGVRVANRYARRLIAPPHRDGGQNQRANYRSVTTAVNPISRVIEWMENRFAEPITVEMLADRAAMSTRTFSRRFSSCVGRPPMEWLTLRRLRAVQEYLEDTDRSLDWIAAATGFGSAELLRYHFRRAMGINPREWRRARRGSRSGKAAVGVAAASVNIPPML